MKYLITFLVLFIAIQSCSKEGNFKMEQPIESVITEQDINYLQSLSPEILENIDTIIYSNTSVQWKKIAMVLAKSHREINKLDPEITYEQLLSRVHQLIKIGKLTSQGNINVMRFSEVRRS